MAPQVILNIENLVKEFPRNGNTLCVLDRISLEINKGDFVSIVGPSGCGKSTLLEIIAKLQSPTSGKVIYSSSGKMNHLHSDLSLIVFQQYNRSLYPFMSVAQNVRFSLHSIPTLTKMEKDSRVKEALSVTKLSAFADYYPWELSGGMQQRVALSRAIAARPMILLLDEAFGSLDTQTRYTLEDELLSIVEKYQLTVLYVTHDIDSAIYCGKRVLAFSSLPAKILTFFENELPYPRDQISTRRHQFFLDYRERLYTLMKKEANE